MTAHDPPSNQGSLWTKRGKPRAVLIGCAVLPFVTDAVDLIRGPQRDVEDWLKIQPVDLAHCTLTIQILFAIATAIGVGVVLVTASNGGKSRKTKTLPLGIHVLLWAYLDAVIVLSGPNLMLATRNAWPADMKANMSADPVPLSTDFDYAAFLNHLWPALVTPAVWGTAAGLAAAVAVCWKQAMTRPLNPGAAGHA